MGTWKNSRHESPAARRFLVRPNILERATDDEERLGGRQNSLSRAQLIIKAAAGTVKLSRSAIPRASRAKSISLSPLSRSALPSTGRRFQFRSDSRAGRENRDVYRSKSTGPGEVPLGWLRDRKSADDTENAKNRSRKDAAKQRRPDEIRSQNDHWVIDSRNRTGDDPSVRRRELERKRFVLPPVSFRLPDRKRS
ncbi:hypothetical protein ALC57_12641 [Trachymyrmex cornetzi]|uniref:Uncharacterized protein n=1 Tax=Trachymyrmex cornetzi TaxID=471704 RepID=A0A195DRG8_9HYME|nr:hypothetical protein ALC57_12641 [Trachymyrmex cornetzi]